jgi:NAD+ diphosphatase
VELTDIRFLCSQPNDYHYREVTYPVLDFFFSAQAKADSVVAALDDVDEFHWLDPASVDLDEIAFPSVRAAIEEFLARRDA